MARLYVARDDKSTVVSRSRVRMPGARPVRHPWPALVETAAPPGPAPPRDRDRPGLVLAVVPPVATALITTASLSVEAGVAAGAAVFFGTSFLFPLLRRRAGTGPDGISRPAGSASSSPPAERAAGRQFSLPGRRAAGGLLSLLGRRGGVDGAVTLTDPADRAAFDRALAIADRISATWPRLGSLINPADAEALLAGALAEIAAVLARRRELAAVLAGLSRPDFAARSASDETARELRAHLSATRTALTGVELELARREASLSRAEKAGHDFIREQEMRQAIRAAEESLRTSAHPELGPARVPDAGADLAEQTRAVVDAYRELTAGPHHPSSSG